MMRLAKSLNDWLLGKGTEYFVNNECERLYMEYLKWVNKYEPKLHRPSYENFINEICDALNIGVIVRFDNKLTGTADKSFYEMFNDASYLYSQKNYHNAWFDAYERYYNTPRCEAMDNAGKQFDKNNADLKVYIEDKFEVWR